MFYETSGVKTVGYHGNLWFSYRLPLIESNNKKCKWGLIHLPPQFWVGLIVNYNQIWRYINWLSLFYALNGALTAFATVTAVNWEKVEE